MTNDRVVAALLKRADETITAPPESDLTRARQLEALRRAIEAPPRRSIWPRLALAAGILVGVVAAAWWARPAGPANPTPLGFEARVLQAEPSTWEPLSPRPGVELRVQGGARVELRDDGTRLLVWRGAVAATVTSRDVPFFLESTDAIVAVRAASVRVTPGAGCDGRTLVEVEAGTIEVSGETVAAPQVWPRCTVPSGATTVSHEKPASPVKTVKAPEPTPAPRETPASVLSRQNALFRDAVQLYGRGELRLAVERLDGILLDSGSPLAEAALAQKMNWLSSSDRRKARRVAEEYLQRFPRGFGRADAETLLLEPQ